MNSSDKENWNELIWLKNIVLIHLRQKSESWKKSTDFQQISLGMIADVDLNGNGKVEFEEFLVMMSRKTQRLDDGDGIDIAFQIFDTDKDGQISSEELK